MTENETEAATHRSNWLDRTMVRAYMAGGLGIAVTLVGVSVVTASQDEPMSCEQLEAETVAAIERAEAAETNGEYLDLASEAQAWDIAWKQCIWREMPHPVP